MGKFFIVDCEADGPCPGLGNLTEFGCVNFHDTSQRFHGKVKAVWPDKSNYDQAMIAKRYADAEEPTIIMRRFADWVTAQSKKPDGTPDRPIFVSDNPAFDAAWINYYMHHYNNGFNPFGHSARRIGDIYAGAVGDLRRPWKHLRDTPHDHNPVNDALGNAEALTKILKMIEAKAK